MYSNPKPEIWRSAEIDFGAGGGPYTYEFVGPKGMRGRLREVGLVVTETFACDATVAHVQIGTASDADAYAKLNIPDATADGAIFNQDDDTDALIDQDMDEDTVFVVTLTEGTDGTAVAGKGFVYFHIDWY